MKAGEAEEAATRGDHKTLYRIAKELTGQRMQSQQIKMTDGKFARTHDELMIDDGKNISNPCLIVQNLQ